MFGVIILFDMFHILYSSIMDCLVTPLQEKTEEWKKSVVQLDKDHAKGE